MTRPTEIIVNRNAKRLRRGALLGRIVELARGRARLWETHGLGELARAAAEIAASSPERVVLCGGDGTFMAGLTALHGAFGDRPLPELALVPAGTVATVARNWGARRPLAALARALDPNHTQTADKSTLRVESEQPPRLGFTFGTGLVAHFFEAYDRAPRRGLLTAAGIAARVFAGSFVDGAHARRILAKVGCELYVEGRPLPHDAYSLIVCSVLRDLGLHFLLTYRADADPERLQLVAASQPAHRLGPQALRVLRGKPLSGDGVVDELVREFSLRFAGGAHGPYVLDGDTFTARELSVRPGPRIRVVV